MRDSLFLRPEAGFDHPFLAMSSRPLDYLLLLAVGLVLALVAAGVFYGRQRAFALYGDAVAGDNWQTWRDGVREMQPAQTGVKRRVPKSPEPPALVLMRDYFGVCLGGSLLLSAVLAGSVALMVRGAILSPGVVRKG